jgi:hypothetical protein
MLKKICYVILSYWLLGCGSAIKTSGMAASSFSTHKIIAILPFEISLASKLEKAKNFSEMETEELKKYMSIALQQHLYESFKKRQKKFPATVSILSTDLTNNILSSKNISFINISSRNKQEISKILNVDAVVFPQAIFGKKTNVTKDQLVYPGEIEMNILIYDSIITEPLWEFKDTREQKSDYLGRYGQENKYQEALLPWTRTIDIMFQNITADFPYKKK